MKKNQEIVADSTVPTIEEVLAAGNAYADLVARYVAPYTKKTDGTRSMGEAGYTFAENAQKRKDQYPEVAPGTFDGDELDVKFDGVTGINKVRVLNKKINDSTDEALVICKTDAIFLANKFYGHLQGVRNIAKYKTAYDELSPYYRKSSSEKVPSESPNKKAKNDTTDNMDTTNITK